MTRSNASEKIDSFPGRLAFFTTLFFFSCVLFGGVKCIIKQDGRRLLASFNNCFHTLYFVKCHYIALFSENETIISPSLMVGSFIHRTECFNSSAPV